ncbi:MAG: helix-turn-helix transcriptional regulator [Candidatus Cloacimonetes bacterium]|nr:helix-turn-helix transcriptional regulator [Candidatus Cloacimonadota bacterium]
MKKINVNELTKNCNEILILALLQSGSKHGYQLAMELEEKSNGYFRLTYGTLYPVLHKLEKEGLIKGEWEAEEIQRKRKHYLLTTAGRRRLKNQKTEWHTFHEQLFNILED